MGDYNKSASIVKLAVIGDVFKEGSVKPIPNDQIKSFKYTLLGDEGFKFVYELVNYDQTFLTSITKTINKMATDAGTPDYTNLDPDLSDLTSLPKILVQFGYEDHKGNEILSKVHFSTVSEVDYKFSQGDEKILVITSIFDPAGGYGDPLDEAGYESTQFIDIIFPIENERSDANVFFKRSSSEVENTNPYISPYDIVVGMCKDLLSYKDGVNWVHLEPSGTPGKRDHEIMSKLILHDALTIKVNEYPADSFRTAFESIGKVLSNPGEGFKDAAINIAESLPDEAGEFIEGKTGFGARQYNDLIVLLEPLKLTLERKYEEYGYWGTMMKITKGALATVGEGALGIAGAAWDGIAGGAMAIADVLDKGIAWLDGETDMKYTFNHNSGANVSEVVYGRSSDLDYYDEFEGEVTLNDSQRHKIANGSTVNLTLTMTLPALNSPRQITVPCDGFEKVIYQVPNFAPQTGVLKDLILEFNSKIAREIAENEALAEVEKAAAEEQARMVTPESDGIKISEMSDNEKLNAFNRNIRFTTTSEEGTSVFETVAAIIKGYNQIFTNGDSNLDMEIAYLGHTSAGDFNTVLLEHEGQPLQTRLIDIVIGLKPDVRKYEEDLYGDDGPYSREILSSPLTKEENDHSIIYIDYGRHSSVTKFFDYTGDIRWLRNISSSLATNHHIGNIYAYLEGRTVKRSYLDVVKLLLTDPKFKAAMDKVGEDITGTLLKLTDQFNSKYMDMEKGVVTGDGNFRSYYAAVKGITMEELEDLKYVTEYIQSGAADDTLNNRTDTFKDSLSSFNLFIASLYDAETVGLLMDKRPADKGFYIKPSNQFDKIAQNTLSTSVKQKLSIYQENQNMFAEVKIKTLGIPELTTIPDITDRYVYFDIYDPSEDAESPHWLSGAYQITGLSHSISPSEGFSSEFTLAKVTPPPAPVAATQLTPLP
mgnify:FL=1|tara:strand:+ start:1549 stop:4353 length:2805 start_codon:yes stop_codon:yes gene_type:complete